MPLNVISASSMGIGEAGITAIFGYCVVFVGLVLLMLVLYIMGAVFKSKAKKVEALKAAEKAAAPAEAPAAEPEKPLAPGSAGHIKRFDVPDKEAAMIMAIVANKLDTPLNELHFVSIKEVKEDEV